MTVYIDIIFIENIVINYIILYATGIVSKSKINQKRMIISSLIGAVYSVIYYLLKINIYSNMIVKLMLSIAMVYIALETKNFKILIKKLVLFYLVSFVFAGAALGIIYMANTQNITIQNGMIVGSYTLKTILIGIVVAFIVIIIGFNFAKGKLSKKDLIYNIKIYINGKNVKTKAMMDTGNFLKEPITNIPVAVVEHTLLYEIIPKEILNNIEKVLGGDFKDIPEDIQNQYISKLKVIPFSSLGKQNGMLLGIKADKLEIEIEENIKEIQKVIIGVYTKSLTKRGEYRALVGIWVNE